MEFKDLLKLVDSYVKFGDAPKNTKELREYLDYLKMNETDLYYEIILEIKTKGGK